MLVKEWTTFTVLPRALPVGLLVISNVGTCLPSMPKIWVQSLLGRRLQKQQLSVNIRGDLQDDREVPGWNVKLRSYGGRIATGARSGPWAGIWHPTALPMKANYSVI